jgi:hypothetical protein
MIEGEDEDRINLLADQIADAIQKDVIHGRCS